MTSQRWHGKMCSTEKWIETIRGPANARSELKTCKRKILYYEQQIKASTIRKNTYWKRIKFLKQKADEHGWELKTNLHLSQQHEKCIVHLLIEYHTTTLDVYAWVPPNVATILEKYNKLRGNYEPNPDGCSCGASQCQGCVFQINSVTFVKIIKPSADFLQFTNKGNFTTQLIKNWLDHISDEYGDEFDNECQDENGSRNKVED